MVTEQAKPQIDNAGQIIPVLYEDNHLLVVNKPTGLLVQKDSSGDLDLLTVCKSYLKERYKKAGNVYLGLVHRLDRPVSGTVLLARTSKAAARLSEQIRLRSVGKKYIALVEGEAPQQGVWVDNIRRRKSQSFIDDDGKQAELRFTRRGFNNGVSLVEIILVTGRHHQIRVQFAHRGYPLLGDYRYNENARSFGAREIALHAAVYTCNHPTLKERMTFKCLPGTAWSENMTMLLGEGAEGIICQLL